MMARSHLEEQLIMGWIITTNIKRRGEKRTVVIMAETIMYMEVDSTITLITTN